MRGTKEPLIVIGDSDGLIALLHEDDFHHLRAKKTVQNLIQHDAQVIFPMTSIVETITTLTRKLEKPILATLVVHKITHGELAIETADAPLLEAALKVFNPIGSKQNTLFDAFVVATAKKFKTNYVFSFDQWYQKQGLHFASDLSEV